MRIGNCSQSFAQFFHLIEHVGALGFRGAKTLELFGLALGQQSRLGGEPQEIVVAGQQFFRTGLRKTVVEGVDQVEGDMAGNEFEGLWNRLFRARQRVLKAFGAKENKEAVSKAGFGSADDSE